MRPKYFFLKKSVNYFLGHMKHPENQIKTYLSAGEYTNGLVYFEQERSTGDKYPYLEPDMKVQTKVIVHDTKGNKWETEIRVTKVKIEPIREICPKFGKTRELSEN